MKHTPGPWKVEYDEAQKMSFVRIPKRVNDVGLDTPCTLGLQKHADALLIAKAPDMFESLQLLRRYHGGDGTVTREQVIEALGNS